MNLRLRVKAFVLKYINEIDVAFTLLVIALLLYLAWSFVP
jgi:hypothetical protein